MNKKIRYLFAFTLGIALLNVTYAQDVPGSKDHPLFTRMIDFIIADYQETEFDSHEFYNADGQEFLIEGHKFVITYQLKDDATPQGALKIKENYINAVKSIGGEVLDEALPYLKVTSDDKEIWVAIWVQDDEGTYYELTIVEQADVEQEVLARPEALAAELETGGRVAVYDIYFDKGKATIQAESESTLVAISTLMEDNPKLKLFVVGHTCNEGAMTANMILSQKRAEAVVNVLIDRFQVDMNRLFAAGVGPLCPIATNKTEEGRAKNRRVELVVQ